MYREQQPQKRVPEFIAALGQINGLFLDKKEPCNEEDERTQKLLEAIWSITSIFYPLGEEGEVILTAPSETLVDIGLVSPTTAERIKGRIIRKSETEKEVDENVIKIRAVPGGFIVTETYMVEETYYEESVRLDTVIEERLTLTRGEDGKLHAQIEKRDSDPHLHTLDKVWHITPDVNSSHPRPEYKQTELTPNTINTTLALLAEAITPGCIRRIS